MKFFSIFRKKPNIERLDSRPVMLEISLKAKAHVESEYAQAALLQLVKHYEAHGYDKEWADSSYRVMNCVIGTLHRMKDAA